MRKVKYKKKNLNVLTVNAFTLILGIVFLIVGDYFQTKDLFIGIFINEVFIILIPAFFLSKGGNLKSVLRINKLSIKNFFRIIFIVILSYPIILLLNGIFLSLISNFVALKNFSLESLLKDKSIVHYLFYMCLVPSICEEVFFRGALLNSYDIYGRKFAIFMSAFVFALFHFDIQNFVAPLLLGILFGNLIELTGSIFAAFIAHGLNNIIAVITVKSINDNIFNYLKHTSLVRDLGSLQLYIIIILFLFSIISVFLIRMIFVKMDRERLIREQLMEEKIRVRVIESIDFFNFVPIAALIILYFIYYGVTF